MRFKTKLKVWFILVPLVIGYKLLDPFIYAQNWIIDKHKYWSHKIEDERLY